MVEVFVHVRLCEITTDGWQYLHQKTSVLLKLTGSGAFLIVWHKDTHCGRRTWSIECVYQEPGLQKDVDWSSSVSNGVGGEEHLHTIL